MSRHPADVLNNKVGEGLSGRTRILTMSLLAAVVAGVYLQATGYGFVNYDDPLYVTDNSIVSAGLSRQGVLWAFTTLHAANWHPITWLSHMLDVQLFGMDPAGHHFTSICLHVVNTLLLLLLLERTTRSFWKSFAAAALFGLHPLHVESVAWVAERKDVLSTLFWLLTMLAYTRYALSRRKAAYVLAVVFFAAGLMAKPMLVTLPFALLLWDFWPLRRVSSTQGVREPVSRLLLEKLPFFALTAASCVVTYYAQQSGGAVAAVKAVPFDFRLVNALVSYWSYIWKLLWPQNLTVTYPLPSARTLLGGMLAGIALAGVSAFLWRMRRLYPFLLVGWLWFLGTLVPVLGLVQVGEQSMADRYTYIPSVGFFLMLAWGGPVFAERFPRSGKRVLQVLAVGTCTALALATWVQVGYWKDSITLFSHASRLEPGSVTALRMLGEAFAEKKDFAAARAAFQSALKLSPDNDRTYAEWGFAMHHAGRVDEATRLYEEALRINPRHVRVQNNLAGILMERGDLTGAISHYEEAQRIDPDNADIAFQLGVAQAMKGVVSAAELQFARALKLRPDFPEAHYNLGIALAKAGHLEEADHHFAEALRMNPSFGEARQALETLRRRTGR